MLSCCGRSGRPGYPSFSYWSHSPEECSVPPHPTHPCHGPSALYPVPGQPPPAVSTRARGAHWADPPEGRKLPRSEASAALGPTSAGMQPLTSCHLRGDTQGPSVRARGLSHGVCPEYVPLRAPPLPSPAFRTGNSASDMPGAVVSAVLLAGTEPLSTLVDPDPPWGCMEP